jgi:hypothetical protein
MRETQRAEAEAVGETQARLYQENSRFGERMGGKEGRNSKFRGLSEFLLEQLIKI